MSLGITSLGITSLGIMSPGITSPGITSDDAPRSAGDATATADIDLAAARPADDPVVWFAADPHASAAARAHVADVLTGWTVDADTIADAVLLVSELVTNVHQHTASEAVGVELTATTLAPSRSAAPRVSARCRPWVSAK